MDRISYRIWKVFCLIIFEKKKYSFNFNYSKKHVEDNQWLTMLNMKI